MHGRADVQRWTRDGHEARYLADLDGWTLTVTWTPEPPKGGPWGFSWSAEGPDGQRAASAELVEEIELAMMAAEAAAKGAPAKPA
ncbi:MAG: hypothetical protein IT374_04435 [Polyangiaceae bacterium]|nr:hypothetical protein [Polyangiaceae bacterium]